MSPAFADRLTNVQLSMIRQIMLKADGCANLAIGEPEFYSPEVVRAEAVRVVQEEKILYTPTAGLPPLCEQIREYHGNRPGDAVCVTNGSQEALFDLIFALVDPGDEVAIPDPGFVAYATVVELAGGVPVRYRLPAGGEFAFSLECLEGAMSAKTKAVVINSPSNPTGRVLTEADLRAVSGCCRRADVFLVSDEIYREIHYLQQPPASLAGIDDQAILLSGVSKMAAMTGWRVGWVCGPAAIVEKATVMHQYTSSCASTLAQKAALQVFTRGGSAAIQRRRARLAANRDLACNWIEQRLQRSYVSPEGAFYLMLEVTDLGRPSLETALELLKDKVALIPGAAFGAEGEGYLRLSFAGSPATLKLGLERLERGLERLEAGR